MLQAVNQGHLLQKLKQLTVINHLVNTIYVNDAIGQIEISKIIKDNNSLKSIIEKIDYKLKKHRVIHRKQKQGLDIIISDISFGKILSHNDKICECISQNINQIFFSDLKSFPNIKKIDYNFFKQGFLKKLFSPNQDNDLVSKILDIGKFSSWVIVPVKFYNHISNSPLFNTTQDSEESLIHSIGKLGQMTVFINPDEQENSLFFGNYDSITLLLKSDFNLYEGLSLNPEKISRSYEVEYLFIETGDTVMLTIN